ncbi:MAG: hypothetical protein U5L74_04420 [Ideonella sp.]|nr:hypothetical protein [Ideonella sp.]
MSMRLITLCASLSMALLTACGETPQTSGTERKVDASAYTGASAAYTVGGLKAGDKAAWESQIRQRNQGQNEYSRAPAASLKP